MIPHSSYLFAHLQAFMYFYAYYMKEGLFKQNEIPIFINLAVGCKVIIFTCEITKVSRKCNIRVHSVQRMVE